MSNLAKIQTAIDFIEKNLYKDISLDNISRSVGMSKFHFHRIFKDLVKVTVAEYIRNRRLSNAAEQLAGTDLRIIDVAVEAKFGSQAAFTKSFKKLFGINPTDIIKNHSSINYFHRARLSEQPGDTAFKISREFTIVHLKEIKLVGMEHNCRSKNLMFYADNAYLWHAFTKQIKNIKNVIAEMHEAYSVSTFNYGSDCTYFFCGVEVSSYDDIPEKMTAKTLPEKTYALFIHRGKIFEELHKTTDYIYQCWLPDSGYELDYNGDNNIIIEKYSAKSTHFEDSEVELLLPVKLKNNTI